MSTMMWFGVARREPCERCGAPEHQGLAWGVAVCAPCWSAWCNDKSMSVEVIHRSLGQSPELEHQTKETLAAYTAEISKRTREWAAKGAAP